jgi:hypothetical protein
MIRLQHLAVIITMSFLLPRQFELQVRTAKAQTEQLMRQH